MKMWQELQRNQLWSLWELFKFIPLIPDLYQVSFFLSLSLKLFKWAITDLRYINTTTKRLMRKLNIHNTSTRTEKLSIPRPKGGTRVLTFISCISLKNEKWRKIFPLIWQCSSSGVLKLWATGATFIPLVKCHGLWRSSSPMKRPWLNWAALVRRL